MYEQVSLAERIETLENKMFKEIKKYIEKYQHPPTVRELRKILEIRSTSTTLSYLNRLKEKGFIDWEPKKTRTIRILLKSSKDPA